MHHGSSFSSLRRVPSVPGCGKLSRVPSTTQVSSSTGCRCQVTSGPRMRHVGAASSESRSRHSTSCSRPRRTPIRRIFWSPCRIALPWRSSAFGATHRSSQFPFDHTRPADDAGLRSGHPLLRKTSLMASRAFGRPKHRLVSLAGTNRLAGGFSCSDPPLLASFPNTCTRDRCRLDARGASARNHQATAKRGGEIAPRRRYEARRPRQRSWAAIPACRQ
jgi:hypothetical protein